MKKKDYTVTIIVVVGLFLLTMMIIVATTPYPQQKPMAKVMPKSASTAPMAYSGRIHIEAIDQSVAGQVAVLSAALKENGYVVVHKEENGKPGRIIGMSKMLVPGLYSNRTVSLTEGVAPGEVLYAMLHVDNGDGVFFAENDTPMKGGEMMMSGTGMTSFMAI